MWGIKNYSCVFERGSAVRFGRVPSNGPPGRAGGGTPRDPVGCIWHVRPRLRAYRGPP
ncbi:hypothetical protein HSR121_1863 [Halapricum desulfuricans]|uniref:Uncharacterized protein n=1 Tax=Halapricum desulfuricans TaxID=2841257 RepID=A0A897N0H7_9EURY|nr:hypothetical protein HSR121_1863 [Halapricum desulfuricans]